jgi:hypothetical protein
MVHHGPSLLRQSIDLYASMDEVNSLSGSDETFKHRVLEQLLFNAAESTFVVFRVDDVSPE